MSVDKSKQVYILKNKHFTHYKFVILDQLKVKCKWQEYLPAKQNNFW